MSFPDIRTRAGYLFLAVAVGHIILISAQVTSRSGVPLLQALVFGAFAEVQRGTAGVVGGVRRAWDGYVGLQNVHAENLALKQRMRDLEVKLQRERALAGVSEGLRRLLDLRNRTNMPTRAAEIIGTSATADFRTITIDRGTDDGVQADMAVISPAGAVGRVVTPAGRAAKVQLLVDRNAAAAVMVERTRAQGIVMGTGENLLRLEYVSTTSEIAKGDVLITSGIDGIYPQGFVVGAIVELEKSGAAFRSIRVKPAVEFSTLEQVLVVLAPPALVGPQKPPTEAPGSGLQAPVKPPPLDDARGGPSTSRRPEAESRKPEAVQAGPAVRDDEAPPSVRRP
jgi:rod shape-determining protein MreC